MKKPTVAKMLQSTTSTETLTPPSFHAPPLPTLPIELIAEILCRLPVKLLLQLQCLCKSLSKEASSLINHAPPPYGCVPQTQLNHPNCLTEDYGYPLKVCSCDGIICLTTAHNFAFLWNPSINKFKMLPPLKCTPRKTSPYALFSFGYDPFADNYKVFVVCFCVKRNKVEVLTMGTPSWRRIDDFPYCSSIRGSGIFVGGTVNWLAFDDDSSLRVIVSLDLKIESYQEVLQPDLETNLWTLGLGVVRDCLCIFASREMCLDVWIMKEYGKRESWTKLYSVPYMEDLGLNAYTMFLYIHEDDQVLLDFRQRGSISLKYGVYDSKNDALKIPEIQNCNCWTDPVVYIESLISPCS